MSAPELPFWTSAFAAVRPEAETATSLALPRSDAPSVKARTVWFAFAATVFASTATPASFRLLPASPAAPMMASAP